MTMSKFFERASVREWEKYIIDLPDNENKFIESTCLAVWKDMISQALALGPKGFNMGAYVSVLQAAGKSNASLSCGYSPLVGHRTSQYRRAC